MKRLLPLLCLCAATVQADPGHVIRATELKAQPFADAATLATLPEQTAVDVAERQGGWYRIKSAGQEGWVRMTTLRLGDGTGKASGDSGLGSTLQFLSTGRSGQSGVTVATGVRGLEAADMANATPDHRAVDRLEQVASSAEDARRFATEQKLKAQHIAYLPNPDSAPAGGSGNSGGNSFFPGGE